jgi:hypothetical protein
MSDRDLYFGDFERDGEEVVRRNLSLGRYQAKKSALATLFLEEKAVLAIAIYWSALSA